MSSEYKYDFSEFANDTADTQKLQNEIITSSIVTEITGVTIEYAQEDVYIYFVANLSGADKTTLDSVVSIHDGVPYSDGGSNWQESNNVSGTSSSTWQDKLQLDFTCVIPDTEYKVSWYMECASSNIKVNNEFQIQLSNDTTLMYLTLACPKTYNEDHWSPVSGFKYFKVDPGEYNIKIAFRNTKEKTCYIRNARLYLEEE